MKSVSRYKYSQIIGFLLQLANYTRQDIAYVVGILGRYTHNQCFTHYSALEKKNLKGTTNGLKI